MVRRKRVFQGSAPLGRRPTIALEQQDIIEAYTRFYSVKAEMRHVSNRNSFTPNLSSMKHIHVSNNFPIHKIN